MRLMTTRSLTLVALSMLIGSMSAAAAQPELLIDVDPASSFAKEARDYYSYRDHKYFAKPNRFKLVRVNLELLESDEPFAISLFDDDVLIVEKISASNVSDLYGMWTGTVLDPPPPPTMEFLSGGATPQDATEARLRWFTISISSGSVDRNTETGETRNAMLSFSPDEVSDSSVVERLFAVESTIIIPFELTTMSGEYRLLPLVENPDYHLLMESDPSKKLPWIESEEDALKIGPELRRRYEEQLEHKKSLGPDPRHLARDKWLERQQNK